MPSNRYTYNFLPLYIFYQSKSASVLSESEVLAYLIDCISLVNKQGYVNYSEYEVVDSTQNLHRLLAYYSEIFKIS